MLRIEHLVKKYGEKPVIENLSLHVEKGEKVALIAPSGCGKTTLLRLICRLEAPDQGRIVTEGDGACVFQNARASLFPCARLLDNVAMVTHGKKEEAEKWLEEVGLRGEEGKYPDEISGGMAQRVVIARALAADRPILYFDEPFKGLDVEAKKQLYNCILRAAHGKTLLLITHDEEDANALCDKKIYFTAGMKIERVVNN